MSAAPLRERPPTMPPLVWANTVRQQRAELKRDVARTPYPRSLAMVLRHVLEPEPWLATMTIFDLLCSCGGMGTVTTEYLLRDAGVRPTRELGDLSGCETQAIAVAIRDSVRRHQSRAA